MGKAKFFGQQIILGRCTFADVSEELKPEVAQFLKDKNKYGLIGDERYVTPEELHTH